ncbi:hypothetical protein BV20DRAFT_351241 [Pilatotrama ljubarskyi]|nr:hypothetical protein BV20DRAFT_351241 [Pilatotrama ljubarskyi]
MSILGAALPNSPYVLLVPVSPSCATAPKGHDPPHLTSSEAPTIAHTASPTQRIQLTATSPPLDEHELFSPRQHSRYLRRFCALRADDRPSEELTSVPHSNRGDTERLESTHHASCPRSQGPVPSSVQLRQRTANGHRSSRVRATVNGYAFSAEPAPFSREGSPVTSTLQRTRWISSFRCGENTSPCCFPSHPDALPRPKDAGLFSHCRPGSQRKLRRCLGSSSRS